MDNNLKKNVIALFLLQVANYIIPILTLPFLTRTLGVDSYGVMSFLLSIGMLCQVVLDFGFNLSATHWIAKNKECKTKVSSYISSIISIKLLLFLFVVAIVYIYGFFSYSVLSKKWDLLTLILINSLVTSLIPIWFFQGIEKTKYVTMYVVFSKIIYLFLILSFIRNGNDIKYVIIFLLVSNAVAFFVSYIFYYKEGYSICLNTLSFCNVKKIFKDSFPFFISRVSVSIYTSFSVFILGNFSSLYNVGVYSSAEKLYMMGQNCTSPVTQALFPYLTRTKDVKVLIRFVFLTLLPIIIGCIIVGFYSKEICSLIFGKEFSEAHIILRYFLILLIINFLSVNFGYPAFSIIERLDLVNYSVYVAGVTQVIILYSLYLLDNITPISIVLSLIFVECIVMLFRGFTFMYIMSHKND